MKRTYRESGALDSVAGAVLIAVLATVGGYKQLIQLVLGPVDATALALLLVGILLMFSAILGRSSSTAVIWPALFLVSLLPASILGILAPLSDYGSEKSLIVLLMLPAFMFCPFLLLRSDRSQAVLVLTMSLIALAFGFLATLQSLLFSGGLYRADAFISGTIWLGILTGLGALFFAFRFLVRGGIASLVATGVCAFGLIAAGNRGAIIAVFVSFCVTFLGRFAGRGFRLGRVALVSGLAVFILLAGLIFGPESSGNRLQRFLTGGTDSSMTVRFELWEKSAGLIHAHPLGAGNGSFPKVVPVRNPDNGQLYRYPHNLILEIAIEHGMIPLAIFLSWSLVAFAVLLRRVVFVGDLDGTVVLSWMCFSWIFAQMSGNLAGSRILLLLLGLALVMSRTSLASRCDSDHSGEGSRA